MTAIEYAAIDPTKLPVPGSALTGMVRNSAGSAVASAKVTAADSLSIVQTVYTDASGNYTVPNVAQGAYTLSITLDDYSTYSFSGTLTAGDTATVNGSISLQAPVITAVSVSNITGYSATITWTTDQQANSTVEYGTTTAYGSSVADPALASSHSVTINNLTPGTAYHFRATSTNSHDLSSSSEDSAFSTLRPPAIRSIAVTDITTTSATVIWTTDQPSSSAVSYGTTTDYGGTASDPMMTTSHSITLTNLSMQTQYHFSVSSTNSYGLTSSSADAGFTTASPITVAITSPSEGATIKRPDIMVKGTITNTTGNETGVTVNGVVATVYGGTFVANHVPLTEGSNTITVTATDTAGYTAAASITITAVTAENYITLLSNIDSGISALEPTLRIDGYADGTTPTLSYLGPGSVDWTNCTSYEACRVKMTTEGIYYFTATGTGTDGNEYQNTTAVTVLSRTELDVLLKAKWEGMKDELANGSIEGALKYFSTNSQAEYREIFELLSSQLPSLASGMREINMIRASGTVAEYYIKRFQRNTDISYFIYFAIDEKGLWKIENF